MRVRSLDPAIDAFLEAATKTHDWSTANCCLFGADYVHARTGVDPAADLRGLIDGEAGARAIIAREGGLVAMAHRRLTRAGLRRRRVTPGQMGDVGLVLLPTGDEFELIGAIGLGRGRWTVRTAEGLRFVRTPAIAAWRLP